MTMHLHRRHRRALILSGCAAAALLASPSPGSAAAKKELIGTLQIAPGKVAPKALQKRTKAKYTGSYFRMVLPGGTDKFFSNSDSRATDKTYTLFRPGSDKGLALGGYQDPPDPPFSEAGDAKALRIVRPEKFAGIFFSITTAETDAQTSLASKPPRLYANGKRLSADFRAWTAGWNKIWFNQGAPKPTGDLPGYTKPVTGTYDKRTRKYELTWYSLIVGGPFNGFTGYWHLQGKLLPA